MSETVHGSAVLAGANGVLIRGATGSGKSVLAAGLIARGARLVADDRVYLSACHGRIVATGPAAISGRIELRGRGIIIAAREQSALIRLVIEIVTADNLERMPEEAELSATILGVTLPCQRLPTAGDHATILLEAALQALTSQAEGLRPAQVWR